VFDPERVAAMKERGQAIVLIRESAETGDIAALSQAAALVAAEGARTSHAAVVARELGKVCIVGCERLAIDPSGQRAQWGDETIEEGDILTVDGATGDIYRGTVDVVRERPTALLAAVAAWRASEKEQA